MARRKSKAISPIIATLILIVIAVVAGVILYGFVMGLVAKTTANTGMLSGSTLTIQGASITTSSSGTQFAVTVVVTNTGEEPVTVTAINVLYASNSSLIGTIPSSTFTSGTNPVQAGNTVQFSGTLTYESTPNSFSSLPADGTPVIVQVVTSGGAYVDYQTTWP